MNSENPPPDRDPTPEDDLRSDGGTSQDGVQPLDQAVPLDDERALERLGEALGYDPQREPPPERVAVLRAAAEQLRRGRLDPPTRTLRPAPPQSPPVSSPPRPNRAAAVHGQVPAAGPDLRDGRTDDASDDKADGATVVRFPRRRALLLGGIAASLGLGVGAGVTGLATTRPGGPATEAIAFVGGPTTARTDARLVNHTWGTELMLDVSGLDAGQAYQVRYRTTGEQTVTAGSFLGVADTVMRCRFNAATLRPDLAAIAVVDQRGDEVMRAVLA